jgi:hypothetical protein|tara:strand:- start:5307 stop:5939 length:633 start_codon:yes stop_codon:yes gene_type:complete
MANTLTGGYGLQPIGLVGSAVHNNGTTQYEIANNYSTAIYNGGIVVPASSGTIIISDQAIAPLGVLSGVEYVDSTTKKTTFLNYWPGSNSVSVDTNFPVKAFVHDNPMQLFKVVADGTNTDRATALTGVFANCNMASVNNGSTNTGKSSDMLDISTVATTNTFDVRIVGLLDDPANADFSALGHQYIVRLNGHFNSGTTIAVGTYATTGI